MRETTLYVWLHFTSCRSFTNLTLTVQSLSVLLNRRWTTLLFERYGINVCVKDRTHIVVESIETTSLEIWIFNLANKYKCMKIEQSLSLRWLYWDVFSRIPILWRHKKVVRQRTFQVTSRHSLITTVWYYASCIKNSQGYSLNQWAENKLRDESYVNCQFIIASNMTLYTVRKSVCESG